jgi:hypothetical protein
MAYRLPRAAPASSLPEERRGAVMGRFCKACGSIYARYAARHKGKPMYGKDHVASPCSHEGEEFVRAADWWEPAIEVLPAPPTGDED